MSQKQIKRIRKIVKKQKKRINSDFIKDIAGCKLWTRIKIAIAIIRGVK